MVLFIASVPNIEIYTLLRSNSYNMRRFIGLFAVETHFLLGIRYSIILVTQSQMIVAFYFKTFFNCIWNIKPSK